VLVALGGLMLVVAIALVARGVVSGAAGGDG
jgi:hypothetical protein